MTDEQRQVFKDVVVPSIYEEYRDVIGDDIIDELLAPMVKFALCPANL